MYGQATLEIPASGNIGPSHTDGLSDELAMIMGHIAATTLSDDDGYVVVTLSDGNEKTIGYNTLEQRVVIGRLERHCEPEFITGLDENGRPELWDH
jgi:hypothetical protein